MDLHVDRITRGLFGITGSITIGKDLNDGIRFSGELFYSRTGQNFIRTPFRIPPIPISTFFNSFYKDLFLNTFKECATNIPINDESEIFKLPWKKGVITLEKCTFTNANLPTHMRSGFYSLRYAFSDEVDSMCTTLVKIESK